MSLRRLYEAWLKKKECLEVFKFIYLVVWYNNAKHVIPSNCFLSQCFNFKFFFYWKLPIIVLFTFVITKIVVKMFADSLESLPHGIHLIVENSVYRAQVYFSHLKCNKPKERHTWKCVTCVIILYFSDGWTLFMNTVLTVHFTRLSQHCWLMITNKMLFH